MTRVRVDVGRLAEGSQRLAKALARFETGNDTGIERKSLYVAPSRRRELPDSNADGSPITDLDQLAVAMGVNRKVAPFFVLQDPEAPRQLRVLARSELKMQKVNGEVPTGAAVLLMLREREANELAVNGGEAPEMMHVTLGFFAKPAAEYTDAQRDKFLKSLQPIASQVPLLAKAFAYAHFNPDDEERDPCAVVLVQSDDLAALHDKVEAKLSADLSHNFPIWIPHVTVAYGSGPEVIPEGTAGTDLVFDRIYLGWGGDQYDIASGEVVPETRKKAGSESKALRHVRTPEGQRQYGLPIGAVITSDDNLPIPHGVASPDVMGGVKMTSSRSGGKTTHTFKKGSTVLGKVVDSGDWPLLNAFTKPDNLDPDEKSSLFTDTQEAHQFFARQMHSTNWKMKFKNAEYERMRNGRVEATVTDTEKKKHTFYITHSPDGSVHIETSDPNSWNNTVRLKHNGPGTQEAVHKTIDSYVQNTAEHKYAQNPREEVPENFMDLNEGVYGKQWVNEGDDPENDLPTVQRIGLLEKKQEDLNIAMVGDINLDAMEQVANTVETYNKMYPGFSRVIPVWEGSDPGHMSTSRAIADNMGLRTRTDHYIKNQYHNHSDTDVDLSEIEHGLSWLRLNTSYFGRNADPNKLSRSMESAAGDGWWSNNIHRLMDQHQNYTKSELSAYTILNHEIGHTVANIAYADYYDPSYETWTEHAKMQAAVRKEFFENMNALLVKWDAGKVPQRVVDDNGEVVVRDPNLAMRDATTLKTARIKQLLSKYGTTNLHELCAEAWAEYMMDKEPRQFAREVGELMHSFIESYMENLDEAGY